MKIACLNALDVMVRGRDIFSLVKGEGNIIHLVRLETELKNIDDLTSFKGSRAFLLKVFEEQFLVSVDNSLVLVDEGGVQRIVLKTSRAENFFWHFAEANKCVFVQEYGQSPTGIYASEDFKCWKKLVTNVELDKHSKHFHYIAWDPYRNWLIATLGDGCLTRTIFSEDFGNSWRPLYTGPWQFVPIAVLKDKIVFGMDSGIVKGGVGVYYPKENKWSFIFLKWINKKVKFAQMNDMKLLDNSIWLAALGAPQVIIASRDLKVWCPVYIEGFSESFNHHVSISVESEAIVCSTGKNLLLFNKDELLSNKPIMMEYKAYCDKLKGMRFVLKRKLLK